MGKPIRMKSLKIATVRDGGFQSTTKYVCNFIFLVCLCLENQVNYISF